MIGSIKRWASLIGVFLAVISGFRLYKSVKNSGKKEANAENQRREIARKTQELLNRDKQDAQDKQVEEVAANIRMRSPSAVRDGLRHYARKTTVPDMQNVHED